MPFASVTNPAFAAEFHQTMAPSVAASALMAMGHKPSEAAVVRMQAFLSDQPKRFQQAIEVEARLAAGRSPQRDHRACTEANHPSARRVAIAFLISQT